MKRGRKVAFIVAIVLLALSAMLMFAGRIGGH